MGKKLPRGHPRHKSMDPWVDQSNIFLEFVCEDSFGVACPAGVDKDLWSRFQAFEKWNAAH